MTHSCICMAQSVVAVMMRPRRLRGLGRVCAGGGLFAGVADRRGRSGSVAAARSAGRRGSGRGLRDGPRGHAYDPDFQQDAEQRKAKYVARAVQKVKDCAGPLNQSVTAYEQYLTEHLKKMADLGYIPPVELDEGPGGIVVPDPTAAADGTLAATKTADAELGKAMFGGNTQYLALLNAKQQAG